MNWSCINMFGRKCSKCGTVTRSLHYLYCKKCGEQLPPIIPDLDIEDKLEDILDSYAFLAFQASIFLKDKYGESSVTEFWSTLSNKVVSSLDTLKDRSPEERIIEFLRLSQSWMKDPLIEEYSQKEIQVSFICPFSTSPWNKINPSTNINLCEYVCGLHLKNILKHLGWELEYEKVRKVCRFVLRQPQS
ncbi:MAG: hypothetical protein ACTSPL_01365 [Candidatus Odinarchaeia archaeon]